MRWLFRYFCRYLIWQRQRLINCFTAKGLLKKKRSSGTIHTAKKYIIFIAKKLFLLYTYDRLRRNERGWGIEKKRTLKASQ